MNLCLETRDEEEAFFIAIQNPISGSFFLFSETLPFLTTNKSSAKRKLLLIYFSGYREMSRKKSSSKTRNH